VEGVTLENLLVVEPRPRNPLLADAFKRLGLAERTGRGVDLIYQGLLRYGRPAPDYSRSDRVGVTVAFSSGPADLGFLELVLEEENRTQSPLPVESLLVLSTLRTQRRVDIAEIAHVVQRPPDAARVVLERLVEAGLVQTHGQARGRTYTLSPSVYRKLGQHAGYVHQVGFDAVQQEEMVKRYVREHGSIQRKDVVELCRLSDRQAKHLLGKLVADGTLHLVGQGRTARYEAGGTP
jgi:ATP-dependent DNA helicase RecG